MRGLLRVIRLPNGRLKPDVRSRWLVFLPVALFALFAPQPAQATQTGLLVRGYQITEIPPTKSDLAYPLCGTSVEPFINATWDYEQNLFGDCGWDSFMLHYTGFIQIPEHDTIEFWIASDDGGTVKIGLEEFGVWQDQGCSATMSGELQLEAGTQELDAWFYENGGGTCFMLAWNIDDTGWAIVQPEFFTSEPLTPETTSTLGTTTTESTTTTSSTTTSTTTIEPSTTTTEMPASTTTTSIYLPTTTAAPQTTTTTPQTTSSTTLYVSSTTTLLSQPTSTTTSTTTTTSTLPSTTTSTTSTTSIPPPIPQPVAEVVVTTSIPATTTIPEPLPETTLTTSPQATSPTVPLTTIIPEPTVSLPVATNPPDTTIVTPSTFVLTKAVPDEPLTQAEFVEALSVLAEATTSEQVQAVVEEILKADLSSDQAQQLVASAEVLTAVTADQAQQLFEQVEETQLSESMAAVIAEALNDPSVPAEVKEAFEEEINIFGNEGFDTYVPVDSAVTVAVRRTIIAGTTILVALPTPAPARRT